MPEREPIWNADHVRVTLFCREAWPFDPSAFIAEEAKLEVDTTSARPVFAEISAGAALGTSMRLEVKRQLNRVDFTIQPRVDIIPDDGPLLIEDALEKLDQLTNWVSTWAERQEPIIVRTAVGCGAMLRRADREAAYSTLAQLLPLIKLEPEHRDFMLRINRPISSKIVNDLEINVMGTWAAIFMAAGFFGIGPTQGTPILGASQIHFAQCVADVNTDVMRTVPFQPTEFRPLMQELLATAETLLHEGAK